MILKNDKMILVDTNILIRLLMGTPPALVNKIRTYLEKREGQKNPKPLFVNSMVLLETFQVLVGNVYRLTPLQAAESMLTLIFDTHLFKIEDYEAHVLALEKLKSQRVDYVDLFLWAKAQVQNDQTQILSFDQDFDRLNPQLRLRL